MSKQNAILQFIKQHKEQKGYPPTLREIGKAVNLKSTSSVKGYIDRLEKKGLLQRLPLSPRSIEIISDRVLTNDVFVAEWLNDVPVAIHWQGRRYVYVPMR